MLKFAKRLQLPLAGVAAVALLTAGGGTAAYAATATTTVSYLDTRITYSDLVSPAAPGGGSAAAGTAVAAGATVAVTAATGTSLSSPVSSLPATLTYTADATGGMLSLTSAAPLAAPVTVSFKETAAGGDSSVLSVPVIAVAAPAAGIQLGAAGTSEDVPTLTLSNDNSTGNIDLAPAATTDPAIAGFTVGNAPANFGGTQAGDVLKASLGTVPPGGHYNGVTLVTEDADGAVLHSTFDLRVVTATRAVTRSDRTYTGAVTNKGYPSLCLDARNAFGHATAGTEVQVWTCGAAGGLDQQFVYDSTARTLSYGGLFVTDPDNGDGPATAVLEPAGTGGNQTVTYRSGRLYEFSDGRVLDAYGANPGNGRLVEASTISGSHNQWWSLP